MSKVIYKISRSQLKKQLLNTRNSLTAVLTNRALCSKVHSKLKELSLSSLKCSLKSYLLCKTLCFLNCSQRLATCWNPRLRSTKATNRCKEKPLLSASKSPTPPPNLFNNERAQINNLYRIPWTQNAWRNYWSSPQQCPKNQNNSANRT